MLFTDTFLIALKAHTGHRLRTALMLSGIAIGVGSVILLTALGDGARNYVMGQFMALGSNLVIVLPGRSETTGGHPPIMGETPRDLTIDDALALLRSRNINRIAPVIIGAAPVSWGGLEREVQVVGSTASLKPIRHLEMSQGRFLPELDPHRAAAVSVIGEKVRKELFGPRPALGEWLRIGDRRFRVVGVIKESGVSIGIDLDDMVLIPVASAQILFDSPSLFRILSEAKAGELMDAAAADIRRIITERHEGEEDITIVTQDSVIATFDKILTALTLGIAGIGAISLAVAGILIMNIMLVSVAQRTVEIGLLKALGASQRAIRLLFTAEALLLSLFGSIVGVVLGVTAAELIQRIYPLLPISAPLWGVASAVGIAMATGVLFGVLPASRAARLDPVTALSKR